MSRVRGLFSAVLGVIGVLWLLVVPAAQVLLGYGAFDAEAVARTGMAADRLSSHVAARPNTWEFESERLAALIRDALRGGQYRPMRILLTDSAGNDVLDLHEPKGPLPWLTADVVDVVSNGHDPVARLTVTYSLYTLVRPVEVAFIVGLISMLVLLGGARLVLRRAADRAMAEVDARGRELAERVRDLDAARHELALNLHEREADRKKLARHAASLEMAASDFAHVAQITTHHLQEPLRTVLSYAQLLVRWQQGGGQDGARGAEYLGFIRSGVHRMKIQMRALATYVSLREADFSIRLLDLDVLMDEVAAAEATALQAAGASLRWSDLPVVVSNGDRLRSVLGALVESALRWRHADRPLRIDVSAEISDTQWLVRMHDNGRSLAERDPNRLFHLLVHDEPGSVSVGLAPARLTVFLLGGALWAEDLDADGANFCFTLPVPE